MKKLTLALLSIVAGLLLGRYYPLVPKKLLFEYLLACCLSFGLGRLVNGNEGNLVTVRGNFQ